MKVIELSFDEPAGATVAQDYSGNGHDATLHEDVITSGRQGNALYTLQGGQTTVVDNPIDYSGNFTIHFWMLTAQDVASASQIVFYVTFAGLSGQVLMMQSGTGAGEWTLLALVKEGNVLRLYRAGATKDTLALVDTYTIPGGNGAITGFAVANYYGDGVGPPLNYQEGTFIDQYTGYNGESFTADQLRELIVNQTTKLAYSIDGVDLKDLRCFVEDARGLIGRPAMKAAKRYDWPDRHGVGVDLAQVVFEPRQIELDIWFRVNSKDEAVDKAMLIKEMVSKPGLRRFLFQAGSRFIPYDVYFPEDFDFEIPLWVDGGALSAKFTLVMIEPQPVKRVLKFVKTGSGQETATITMTTNKELFSIYWGDGNVTHNVGAPTGPSTAQHTYTANGEYFITVAGAVEKLTTFDTNSVVLWPRSF